MMSLEYSVVSFVAQKFGELLVDEAKLLWGVEGQVRSMQRELTWMQSYLMDVDKEQEESSETLRTQIREIMNIALKAEDVIDSFILAENTRRRKSLLKRYACFFNYLMHIYRVGSEIKSINTRIRKSRKMFERYQIRGRNEQIQRRRLLSSHHSIDECIIGLEDDVKRLVKKLTTTEHEENVLCIVGIGGSGKTILASKLYNHEIVKHYFERQLWVSISQEWSVNRILDEILRQLTGQMVHLDDFDSIEESVKKVRTYLEETLYLIVLDDVWETAALKDLLPAFPFSNRKSKIIITTRIFEVVRVRNLFCSFHEPRRLNDVESWELLAKIVLNQWQTINNYQLIGDFEKLGKVMLKKCAGIPLAIIALGGILSAKESIQEWEMVSKDVSAKVMEDSGTQNCSTVKDILALSYCELPNDLKPYFLYLALFSEDFVIPVGKMIRMWISEGFITEEQCCGEETLEDVARQFLDELIQRCVVQVWSRSYGRRVKEVRIHNLIRELCVEKAKERGFLAISSFQSSAAQTQVEDGTIIQSCRISIHSTPSNTCIPFPARSSHLRSLFVFQQIGRGRSLNLEGVHKNFQFLKVLSIVISPLNFGVDVTLPAEIGNLIHLTYLGIYGPIKIVLPESIVNLRNLLTLDCKYGCLQVAFHKVSWKFSRLRHLLLESMEVSVETSELLTLESLQTLWGVEGGNWMLNGMSTLSPTVKRLGIKGIRSNEQLEAVFQCPSFKSGYFHTLSLKWGTRVKLRNIELSFLCHSLCRLDLCGEIGEEELSPPNLFPPNLEKVSLRSSMLISNETMAFLGKLPNLRYLFLDRFSYDGEKWTCSAGEYPQLEHLEMCLLISLKEWRIENGAMSKLSFLRVSHCSRLNRLPKLGYNVVVDWKR